MQSATLGCDSLGLSQCFFSASILLLLLLLWSLFFSAPFLSVPFLSPILLLLVMSFQVALLFLILNSCLFCIDPVSSHADYVTHNIPYFIRARGGQHTAIVSSHSRNTQVTFFFKEPQLSEWAAISPGKRGDLQLINEARLGLLKRSRDPPLCTCSFVPFVSWVTLSSFLQHCFLTIFWISCPSVSRTVPHVFLWSCHWASFTMWMQGHMIPGYKRCI